jgi:hypothetical protein
MKGRRATTELEIMVTKAVTRDMDQLKAWCEAQ